METDESINSTLGRNELDEGRIQPPKLVTLNDLESGPNDGFREKGGESSSGPSSTDGEEFDVKWDGPDDPGCPKNMSNVRKWICTWVVSLGSLCV